MRWYAGTTICTMLVLTAASACAAQQGGIDNGGDPPGRVGRVSFISGNVSLYPNGGSDWTDASLNYPLSSNDGVWADAGARAEVELGSSSIRFGSASAITFGEVSDTVTQLRLDQGSIDVHVRFLNDNEVYEIDTPSGVISLVDEGHYRIDVTPDGRRTTITVRDGDAAIERASGDPWDVRAGSSAVLTGPDARPIAAAAVAVDDWERWADSRDERADAVQSTQYVSRDMVGYQDLDQYGTWNADATYGNVWYPQVSGGWAPYRNGRWASVGRWGWTWIDDEPWGFAPFHYGRWAYIRNRWGWVPGPIQLRPVYAPALVAFVGGDHWGASFSAGSQPIGWFPLGPGEPYVPTYRASPRYLNRVNYAVPVGARPVPGREPNVRYVNRNVPGAFVAVPRDAFVRSRPVPSAALPVRSTDVASAQPIAPPTPARVGPPPRSGNGRDGVRPPAVNGRAEVRPAPAPAPWRRRPEPPADSHTRSGNEPARDGRGAPPAGAPVQPPNTPQVGQPPAGNAPPPRMPPRPSGPPSQQPTPAPVQSQPPVAPPVQPGQPGRGRPDDRPLPDDRGRGDHGDRGGLEPNRPHPPTPLENSPEWQKQRADLIAKQQQEAADLARRQAEQNRARPNPAQADQQKQAEQKALIDRQQQQRDQVDRQYRRQPEPPPPAPPPPPAAKPQPPPPPPPPATPPRGRPRPRPDSVRKPN